MRRFAIAVLSVVVASVQGQIVLKPSGEDAIKLSPKTVDVRAEIRGGVADAVWTYTFANADRFRGQADFLIAIPKGGVVHGFAYWYQGEKVVARVTEKERARRIYQAIVSRQRDPALIEMVGKNTFRVRVFPIDGSADLKVELKMAQVLDSTPAPPQREGNPSPQPLSSRGARGSRSGGATYSIPLRSLGKLESARVEVTGAQKVQGSWGRVGNLLTYAIQNSNATDLKVTEAWERRALHASLRAARSGGPGGFFALTLTPSQALRHRRWRLEGDVADVIEVAGSGGSVTLVGRYRKPGTVRAWLMGDGYKASTDLVMPDEVEANGPAAKLWAWSKIGRSRDRKEVVRLSMRHAVPSKHTSWIAIPTEERKRMAREIAQAELQNDLNQAAPALVRYGLTSAKGRAIVARLRAAARQRGLSLDEVDNEQLNEYTERMGKRWAEIATARGEAEAERSSAGRELTALEPLGFGAGPRAQHYYELASELADAVLRDRVEGRRGPAAERRSAQLRVAAKRSNGYTWEAKQARTTEDQIFLQYAAAQTISDLANTIVADERQGKPTGRSLQRLRRYGTATKSDVDDTLRQIRTSLAQQKLDELNRPLADMISKGTFDEAALKKDMAARAKEVAILRANGVAPESMTSVFGYAAYIFTRKVYSDQADPKDWKRVQEGLDRYGAAAGVPSQVDWDEAWRGVYEERRRELEWAELAARRDRAAVEKARARLRPIEEVVSDKLRSKPSEGIGWNVNPLERDAYVRARHRGEDGRAELQRLYAADLKRPDFKDPGQAQEWAAARRDALEALTELDRLDEQKADPKVLERIQTLEQRAKELRARMGDPIVSIEAPEARVVVAKMPDGSWLPMHRVTGTDRWEGRFDVPAGIADGRYSILVFVNGERKAAVPLNVDTSAPAVEVRWSGGRAEVSTDADVKRVAGFTPSGERIEMVQEAPGRFAARVPVGTEFVATDGAHNRSDVALTPGGERGFWTNPGVVSALAFVGERLWVGTANDGGGFDGEARDAERPWVKAAVAYGDGLAVRYADGAVVVRGTPTLSSPKGEGSPLRLPRHSTCLAADGETLLVGTIGGFFEVRGQERRDVFPKELAGLVVTALLRDGERTWVGTQGRGLAEVFDDGRVVWHDERRGLRDDWVTCLGRDAAGRVVVGTFVGGASVLGGSWRCVAGTEGTCVTGISGEWIATRQGVLRAGKRVSDEEATALVVRGDEVWIGTRLGPKRVR